MRIEKVSEGYAICADSTESATRVRVRELTGNVSLIIADPPYGNVLKSAKWDQVGDNQGVFVDWMLAWTKLWSDILLPNAAFYVWGGIGVPGFRPFYDFMSKVERQTQLKIANHITWSKKRGYGIQHNYLFTREELAYLFNGSDIKKPRVFHVPHLETLRGYSGYNKKYPAHDERYRRTNVWMDVTELLRGKWHDAQKPHRVMEIPIEVHTDPGDWVIDPFAGSAATAHAARKLGRRFVVIEKDEKIFEEMVDKLRVNEPPSGVESECEPDIGTSAFEPVRHDVLRGMENSKHAQDSDEGPVGGSIDARSHDEREPGHRPDA